MIAELRNSKEVQDLMTGILNLDNIEECYKFFDELCTIHELKSIAQRFAVSKMLKENIPMIFLSKWRKRRRKADEK